MSSLKQSDLIPTDIPPIEQYPAGKNTPGIKNIRNVVSRRPKRPNDNNVSEGRSDGAWSTKKIPSGATEEEKKKQKYLNEWLIKAQSEGDSPLINEVFAIMECMASELYDLSLRIASRTQDPTQGIIPKTRLFRGKPPIVNGNPIFDSYGAELNIASKKIPDFITWADYKNWYERLNGRHLSINHNQQFHDIVYLSRMLGNIDIHSHNIGLIRKNRMDPSLPGLFDYRIIDYGYALEFGDNPLPESNKDFFDMEHLTRYQHGDRQKDHFSRYYIDDRYKEFCTNNLTRAAISFVQIPPEAIKKICDKYDKWLAPYVDLKCNLSEIFGLNDFKAGSIYDEIIRRQQASRAALLEKFLHFRMDSTELHPTDESKRCAAIYLQSRSFKSNQADGWHDYVIKRDTTNKQRMACTAARIKRILEPIAANHQHSYVEVYDYYHTVIRSEDLPLLDSIEAILAPYGAKRITPKDSVIESIVFDNENTLMRLGISEVDILQKRLKETMEQLQKQRAERWTKLIPKLEKIFTNVKLAKPVCCVEESTNDYPVLAVTLETKHQKECFVKALAHAGVHIPDDPHTTRKTTVVLSYHRFHHGTNQLLYDNYSLDFLLGGVVSNFKYRLTPAQSHSGRGR